MGRGDFLLQRQRGMKRPPERATGGADGDTHGDPEPRGLAPALGRFNHKRCPQKNHPGAWRLVLRAGKLLGKPASNSFQPSIPTVPELDRPSQNLQHTTDPKSSLPSSPVKQTRGIGPVYPRNRTPRNSAVALATAERSGLQIPT